MRPFSFQPRYLQTEREDYSASEHSILITTENVKVSVN